MKRTLSLIIVAALATLATSNAAQDKRPNVLFIVCDDLTTRVSTSGYEHISTPNFERLADAGMTFQRAYAQYPVCGPSRASFLSGLYPQSTGIISNQVDIRDIRPGTKTMPQVFKEQGYWTGSVGKVFHNAKTNYGDVAWNEFHYFDNEEMPLVTPIREKWEAEHGPIDSSRQNARAWREFYLTIAPQTADQKPGYGPTGLRDDEHRDGKNVRQVVSWLEEKPHGDQPFFMAVGIHKPHGPYLAPDEYFELYPQDELVIEPADPDFWEHTDEIAMTRRYEGFDFEFGKENDALRRAYTQAYHACISFVDAQIGLIFDSLKEQGLWDDTIIVLTSDHGYLLGEKFMWGKVFLWDKGTRVPMVVRAPGLAEPGSSSDSRIGLIDLFPTLAELCQVEAPDNLQGESIVPILKNPEAEVKEYAYTVVRRNRNGLGKTIHGERYHYVNWPNGAEELYDLQRDPKESNNLARSPEHKQELERLRAALAVIDAMASSQATKAADAALKDAIYP